jgi:hypothetical protein
MKRTFRRKSMGSLNLGLLLLLLFPAWGLAQQPPLEGAVSPEPEEPREQLAQPNLEGAEAIFFGVHRLAALVLAPIVEFGVEKGLLGRGSGEIGGFKIAPGSLGSGSGVGAQASYEYFSEPFWAGVEGGISVKGYMDHSAFIGARDVIGNRFIRATGRYRLETENDFSGLGMGSPEDAETDYRQEEITIIGDGQVSPAAGIRLGLRGGYRTNSLLRGKNDDIPDISDVFVDSLTGVALLPGLSGENADYVQGGAFVAYDTRNDAGNPDRGLLVAGGFDAFRGVSDTPFDWNRFSAEIAGYLPLPDETRVIALRLTGVHQNPLHGQELVPFYYFSALGGANFLRSYSSLRFQENDVVYAAAEFRRRVWAEAEGQAALDASLFVESAGVYRDLTEELELGDMEQSYGTELRLLTPNDVVARLGFAGGGEGVKLYVGGGGRF